MPVLSDFLGFVNVKLIGRLSKKCASPWSESWAWGVAFLFFCVVGFLKVQQYRCGQNQAFDLGVYTNLLWNTAHGRFFYYVLRGGENYLGNHFAPLLFLFSPLYLFGSSPLPLVLLQTLALAMAIPAVYRLAARASGKPSVGFGFALWFSVFPFVHRVSRFDFHEVALAVPLFFWLLDSWETDRPGRAAFLSALLILVREDCILYVAAAALWAATLGERPPGISRRSLWCVGGAALVWFGVVMFVVMPRLSTGAAPVDINFGNLGGGHGLAGSLFHPDLLWRESFGQPEKRASLLALLSWTGGLMVLAPRRAVLAGVPLFVTLLGSLPAQYRFEQHYSALILPFLFWASAGGWARGQAWLTGFRVPDRWLSPFVFLFFAGMITLGLTHQRPYYVALSQKKREALRHLLALVPPRDPIHATENLVPMFAARREIRIFPALTPTRWVALDFSPTGFFVPADVQKSALNFNRRFRRSVVFSSENLRLFDLAPSTRS